MDFGLSFGAVGDFISIALLIKDIVASLDDCRGSAKQYRELVQGLDVLSRTLEAVQKVYENLQLTNSLEDLSKISQSTISQIRSCLHGFLDQISKYEPSLGVHTSGSGNTLRSISRKIQWKLNEKDIDKFRTEIAGYTMTLKVLLEITTMRILQRNHNSLIQGQCNAESRTAVLISQSAASIKSYIGHLGRQLISRLDIVNRLGIELKRSTRQMISMMFTITGDLSSIRTVIMRLDRGPSDEHFVLDDITGRAFPIHLKTITSWEMLDFILKERFKGKKGARRIQRKLYSLQEDNTHRGLNWSTPWENAFLPYQRVTMSLMCKEAKASNTGQKEVPTCPFCQTPSDAETGVEAECQKCKRFFTRVVEVDNDDPIPIAPIPRRGESAIRFGESSFSGGLKRRRGLDDTDIKEDETCHTCHQSKRRKPQTTTTKKRDLSDMDSDSDDGDVQGLVRVHLISKKIRTSKRQVPFQANQAESFDQLAQKVLGKVGPGVSYTNGTTSDGLFKNTTLQKQDNPAVSSTSNVRSCNIDDVHRQINAILSSTISQSGLGTDRDLAKKAFTSTSHKSTSQPPSETLQTGDFATRLETPVDKRTMARQHQIPNGYSLKHWDPDEKPILLLGSVFDANSLGKWIYDWAVFVYHPATPLSDMAGELWLLLIQLTGKVKRSEERVTSIQSVESRELVEDFIEAGDRLAQRFRKLLSQCESIAVKAWKARTEKELKPKFDSKDAIAIIEAMFGIDQEFGRTEKFMTNARLFNLRFDANCEMILRNPII